jgi:methyltransferase (TIGR00027 family)
MTQPTFENISDTARWAAVYRARETDRKRGLFRDPFARRLAGERGEKIVADLKRQDRNEWAWVIRTYLFDDFITRAIQEGADTIVNLAAGLDARPYRLSVPSSLKWIEVDLPELLAHKEGVLRSETPKCQLERVALDLSNRNARRELFQRIDSRAKNALIITEGLLIYLDANDVKALADDLAERRTFRQWVLDVASPGLLRLMQREVGAKLEAARAPLKFGPPEGPHFFEQSGWRVAEVRSTLKSAAKKRRVPWWGYLFALFPEPKRPGNQPWSGICLLENVGAGEAARRHTTLSPF